MSESDMRVNVEKLAPDVAGAHPGYEALFIVSSAAARVWWNAEAQLRAPASSGGSGQPVARVTNSAMRGDVERLAPDVAGAHPGYEALFIVSSAAARVWWNAETQLRAPAPSGGSGQSWSCASTSPT